MVNFCPKKPLIARRTVVIYLVYWMIFLYVIYSFSADNKPQSFEVECMNSQLGIEISKPNFLDKDLRTKNPEQSENSRKENESSNQISMDDLVILCKNQDKKDKKISNLSSNLIKWHNPQDLNITQAFFERNIDFSSLSSECVPLIEGYTSKQEALLFGSNVHFEKCIAKDFPFIFYNESIKKVEMNCTDKIARYALGNSPNEEIFGPFKSDLIWKNYSEPFEIGDTEFVFGSCGSSHQAILINKKNEKAAERAIKKTKQLNSMMKNDKSRPLSVFLIIVDSVSRQHFYRSFPQTIDFLNKEIVEGKYKNYIAGYDFSVNNANGENTYPNMIPMLFGHNQTIHKSLLKGEYYQLDWSEQKYAEIQKSAIWKHFENYGFVTAFAYETIWDFMTKGLGKKILTDHRISKFVSTGAPLFDFVDSSKKRRCYGVKDLHRHIFDYSLQFLQNYSKINKFMYMHLSAGHEDTGLVVRTVDPDLVYLLNEIFSYFSQNTDEDFAILLGSDHGRHVGNWDITKEGQYENKLPFQFLFTNSDLIKKMGPRTDSILQTNTKRLAGKFDWHLTLKHLATVPYGRLSISSHMYQEWKKSLPSPASHSVFLESSPIDRKCNDLDIPAYLCSCIQWTVLEEGEGDWDQIVPKLANQGISSINKRKKLADSSEYCIDVSLDKIIFSKEHQIKDENLQNREFITRISLKEDQKMVFELYSYFAQYSEFMAYKIHTNSGINPINETEFTIRHTGHTIQAQYQLFNISRVDNRTEDLCEIVSVARGMEPGFCACKKPKNIDLIDYPQLAVLYFRLKKKFSIVIGEEGMSCEDTCSLENKECSLWGLELINSKQILEGSYFDPTSKYFLRDNRMVAYEELYIEEVEESQMIGIEGNTLHLAQESSLSCKTSMPSVSPICPCKI
ncbi:unnamed protein product [Blepharisma stoltei]|uniref:Uncharacterized protein n=1 Tax=Blepharisma stoltei TaxID=1481888 RepID=A0AAU9IGP3_9CILI|nr:unnamed protein product [Blepharisma stoltei]